MSRRRRDSPGRDAIVGIVGVVVLAAITWVSYGALRGLPLQDRYRVEADVPNASRLRVTDEVRIAGIRVGQVEEVTARTGAPPVARLRLALEPEVGELPADTTIAVRPASVLGATYVDLVPGTAPQRIPDGGALPRSAARGTVALTDLFGLFDAQASRDLRTAVTGFGDGLAGRGPALGTALGAFARLLPPLERVAGTLAAPSAGLGPFLEASARFSGALAPVADRLASLTSGGATTFAALAADPVALGAALRAAAPAERAVTRAFTAASPALDRTARLSAELRPAARAAPGALRAINATLAAGRPVLREVPALDRRLRTSFDALTTLGRLKATRPAIRIFGELMDAVATFTAVLAPAQVHCNVIPLTGQNFSSFIGTVGSGQGPALWNLGVATTGAQGEAFQAAAPAPDLRVNYLPNSNASECESGNEPPVDGGAIGNPDGLQPRSTRETTPPPGALEKARAAGLLDEVAP